MTTVQTYSLHEYAAILMGAGPDGTAATVEPSKVKWLAARLRGDAQPVLPGFKAGRRWMATADDVSAAIELLRPKRVWLPPVPTSMTRTSQRRLAS